MRRFLSALVFTGFVFGVPAAVQPAQTVTFSVTYGTVKLGTWDRYVAGKSKAGLYDGATFDSSNGPGFARVSLTRAVNAADLKDLFATLTPSDQRLVVQGRKNGKVVSTTVCEKSTVSDFGPDDRDNKLETLNFACAKITIVPVKTRP
jgi:hypothetical protein